MVQSSEKLFSNLIWPTRKALPNAIEQPEGLFNNFVP